MNPPQDRRPMAAPGTPQPVRYPHLVVRIYSAVYQREELQVLTGAEPCARIGFRTSFVRHPQPFLPDGSIGPDCRELLVHAVQGAVRRTGFRMCLVWSADRCTFVEKDEIRDSDEPPSGGLDLPFKIQFEVRQPPRQTETAPQEHAQPVAAAARPSARATSKPPDEDKSGPET